VTSPREAARRRPRRHLLDVLRQANRPGPPEHSVALRLAASGAVVAGIAACHAQGELSTPTTAVAVVLVAAGSVFSYRTRTHPARWLKPLLAAAVVGAFAWFFATITSVPPSGIAAVEGPLAALFGWVQVIHAFDVPARRDLAFSLAGSASSMAVAAAQAVDSAFAWYVAVWLALGLWGLFETWRSASGGGRIAPLAVAGTLGAVALLAAGTIVGLPAPHVSANVSFPAAASRADVAVAGTGPVGDARLTEPARPGSPAGPARVGGYLGFATHLDTALRARLGNQVVLRVRAQRPTFWLGETFDRWTGTSWVSTARHPQMLDAGPPFAVPPLDEQAPAGPPDLQTFYVAVDGPNLLFHAPDARQVWFPASHVYADADGTLLSPVAMGAGTVYTVESDVAQATPEQLAGAPGGPVPPALAPDLALPAPYRDVAALAAAITRGQSTTYGKVEAIITWMASHIRYSTDIPPLPPGADAVEHFLFASRVGYCEQISTALAVMLRTEGIPTREAVGYVPGSYNPITDLYEVRASDAHAWVQVWFPGFGWQSFDPTATVPDANPSPGSVAVHDLWGAVHRLPIVPLSGVVLAATVATTVVRVRRHRPATWAERLARRIERAGARAGIRRPAHETLSRYAAALDEREGNRSGRWQSLATVAEAAAYGGRQPPAAECRRILRTARRLRVPPPAAPSPVDPHPAAPSPVDLSPRKPSPARRSAHGHPPATPAPTGPAAAASPLVGAIATGTRAPRPSPRTMQADQPGR